MALELMATPEIKAISPMLTVTKKHVPFDPGKNSPDYHLIDGKVELSADYLKKLSSAAGIIWNNQNTKCLLRTETCIVWQAEAAIRKEDGTLIPVTATKEIDLKAKEDEIYMKWQNKKLRGEKVDPDYETRREMIQWRLHKVAKAETGAMKRCIKALLGLGKYTLEELKDGFDVQVISFTPDFNDPLVRQLLLQQAYGFSASQIQAPISRPALQAPANDDDDDYIDAPILTEKPALLEPEKPKPPTADLPKPTKSVQMEETQPTQEQKSAETEVVEPAETQAPATANHTDSDSGCSLCGAEITAKVAEYSRKNFGVALCFGCQKKQKAGEAA